MKRKLLKRTVLLSPNYPHQSYPHQNYDPLQEPMPILMKYSIFGGLKQLMAAIYSHFDHPIYDQYTVCIYSFFLWHLVLTTQPWCVHINVYKHVYIYIYGIPTSTNIIMSACIDKCIYIYIYSYINICGIQSTVYICLPHLSHQNLWVQKYTIKP